MMLARRNAPKLSAVLMAALALVLPGWLLAQAPGKAELLWLGQAAWKITTPGAKVIVIDPWLTQNPKPDLILMPIGGHFVMDPKDAAYATKELLKPKFVIPMHYGTTPVLKGNPQEYLAALGQVPTKVFVLNPGDKIEF